MTFEIPEPVEVAEIVAVVGAVTELPFAGDVMFTETEVVTLPLLPSWS